LICKDLYRIILLLRQHFAGPKVHFFSKLWTTHFKPTVTLTAGIRPTASSVETTKGEDFHAHRADDDKPVILLVQLRENVKFEGEYIFMTGKMPVPTIYEGGLIPGGAFFMLDGNHAVKDCHFPAAGRRDAGDFLAGAPFRDD
jgi:hypothetical protein